MAVLISYNYSYHLIQKILPSRFMCNNIRIYIYIYIYIYKISFLVVFLWRCKNFDPLINGRAQNEVVTNGLLRKVRGPTDEKLRAAG